MWRAIFARSDEELGGSCAPNMAERCYEPTPMVPGMFYVQMNDAIGGVREQLVVFFTQVPPPVRI